MVEDVAARTVNIRDEALQTFVSGSWRRELQRRHVGGNALISMLWIISTCSEARVGNASRIELLDGWETVEIGVSRGQSTKLVHSSRMRVGLLEDVAQDVRAYGLSCASFPPFGLFGKPPAETVSDREPSRMERQLTSSPRKRQSSDRSSPAS